MKCLKANRPSINIYGVKLYFILQERLQDTLIINVNNISIQGLEFVYGAFNNSLLPNLNIT